MLIMIQPDYEVAGGGEQPLGEKLLNKFEFEFKPPSGEAFKLAGGAIELHRLVVDDRAQLVRRKEEITKAIIDATCSFSVFKEVRQTPLPIPSLCSPYVYKPLPRRCHFSSPARPLLCSSPALADAGIWQSCC